MNKGYPNRITDTADEVVMGGPTKIDSVQNLITLRSDLHDAWENYEYGVDPNVSPIQVAYVIFQEYALCRTIIGSLHLQMEMRISMAAFSSWTTSKTQLFAHLTSYLPIILCRGYISI
jgi:HNH endonuclease